jgi:hypothetical protein
VTFSARVFRWREGRRPGGPVGGRSILGEAMRGNRTLLVTFAAGALTLAVCTSCGKAAGQGGGRDHLPGALEFGFTEEQFTAHVEKTQALIAKCMADAGFEYVPVNVKTIQTAQKYVRTDPHYTRRDYHAKWGYGETTRFDEPSRSVGLGPQNLQIYKALPGPQQEAYDRTLFGTNRHADFVFTLDEEDFSTTGGCTRKAVDQTFKPDQVDGTFENPKDTLINDDERVVAAREKWSACMRGHGYHYKEDQDEIISEYGDRLGKILGEDDPMTLTGDRATQLRALQAQEVAVSLADLDCEIKHTDAVYRTVEIEVYGHPVSG